MTFYKKSSFNFLLIEILISVIFIINVINTSFINLSTLSSPIAYGLTNEDRYNSGYVHGCNDAKVSDNGSKHPYLDSNGGPSTHTDTFMKGYDAGYKKCLPSSSHVAPNAGDNTTLLNKDQLTLSSNTTSGHHLSSNTTFDERDFGYKKGCGDVKNGGNENLFQLEKTKRLTNTVIEGYNDGFHSCSYNIRMCPSISYDGSIVAYIDTKNNDTVISSSDAKGTLAKVTTINSESCPTLSGDGREVSYAHSKPDSDVTYLDVTDLSNVLFPSSMSNINTLKNATAPIDNDYGYGLDRSLDVHPLSFSGKIIAYSYDDASPDDVTDIQIFTSTKNSHGNFQKPIKILDTNLNKNISNVGVPSVALSGDGKHIVFNNQTDEDHYEIYTTKVDNPNKIERVTIKGINSDNTYNYFPAVSYDGKTIAYVANNGIYIAKLNEDGEWITSNVVSNSTFNNIIDGNDTRFSLSPDGNKIAYAAFDGSYKQIFVKDISNMPFNDNDIKDQSNDRSTTVGKTIQVTHNNFNNFEPVLSYDGSKVAFQSGDKVVVKNVSWHS